MLGAKGTGHVLLERPYKGPVEPIQLTDSSRWKNHGVHTDIDMVQLPSGQWVRELNGASSYIVCGNDKSLDFTTEKFFLSLWMEVSDVSVQNYIYGRGEFNVNGYMFALQLNNQFYFYTSQGAANQQTQSVAGVLSINTPYMITVVRDGEDVTIYRNSTDVTSVYGIHIDPVSNTENFNIGIRNDLTSWPFGGKMGLLKAGSFAPTLAQIRASFNNEKHLFGYGR